MELWKIPLVFLLFFLISLVLVLTVRVLSPRQIDDVNPYMNCSRIELDKADVFYVVPKFNDISINESRVWCDYILSMNKTLQLHGIKHTYEEFNGNISNEEIQEGIDIFYDCFGFYPTEFKPPQLVISKDNKKLIKSFNLKLNLYSNELFHKVYHCNDSGLLPNKFHDLI